jgi:hypothetical protein
MGGLGSGRPGLRVAVEDALRLDLAAPAVRQIITCGKQSAGSWTWSNDGGAIASVQYVIDGIADITPDLTLLYRVGGEPVRQRISFARTRPHFGGERWWFVCPLLIDQGERRLVRALFLPPGARVFGSRQGHGLNYRSQKESRSLPRLVEKLLREYG